MLMTLYTLVNLGISHEQSQLEQRRIRLVNSFALISAVLILLFGTLNITIGSYFQATIIYSGLIYVSFPPLYFNAKKKYGLSKHYFTIISNLFIIVTIYKSISLGQNRYNEVFMIGFSALLIMIFDNPAKAIYFVTWALLTLGMVTWREMYNDNFPSSDTLMGYINTIAGFLCIYFFTSLYKRDLMKSNRMLEITSRELDEKSNEVIRQRDEIYANKQFLRAAIDSLPVFIALLDMEGKYLIANSRYEEVFGMPIEEIEGRDYKEVLSAEIKRTHDDMVARGLNGEELEFEERSELPNGENIEVMGKYLPVRNKENEQFALAVYVVDVTKLKQAEARLIVANNDKNRLLSLISHDIKSPLNSLQGLIDLADNLKEDEMKGFIKKVSKKLSMVSFSLDNLLNWAKAQMDGFKIKPRTIKISGLIEQSIALFDDKLNKKHIKVETMLNNSEPDCWIDEESTKLVIRNILSNAIKFTPNEGSVQIEINEDRNYTILSITDSGEGISDDCIQRLKEGAQYVKSTTGTIGEQGTGLGLSLSFEIMKKNNGRMELFNNKDKSGATVRLYFPKAPIEQQVGD